jgi:hypothetical protein
MDDVGIATTFLVHDSARLITGETLSITAAYHIIDNLASARTGNRRGRHGTSSQYEKVTS